MVQPWPARGQTPWDDQLRAYIEERVGRGDPGAPGAPGAPGGSDAETAQRIQSGPLTRTALLESAAVKTQALVQAAALTGAISLVNAFPNPSAEYTPLGWVSAFNATVAPSTEWAAHGMKSVKFTFTANNNTAYGFSDYIPVGTATKLYAQFTAKNNAASTKSYQIVMGIDYYNASGANIGGGSKVIGQTLAPGAVGTSFYDTYETIPAGAATVRFTVTSFTSSPVQGESFYFDDIVLMLDPPAGMSLPVTMPFDGDAPLSYWSGAPGSSQSIRLTPAPSAQDQARSADSLSKSRTDRYNQDGDSLFEQMGNELMAATGGEVLVTNLGKSAHTSADVATNVGASVITVSAGTIPASGASSAFTITDTPYVGQHYLVNDPGTLAGVPGSMNYGSGVFTRATAGSAVTVPAGTPFVPDLAALFDPTAIHICGFGQNDLAFNGTNPTVAPTLALKAITAKLTPALRRVLMLGTHTGATQFLATVTAQNVNLRAAVANTPGAVFLDVHGLARSRGLAMCGLTPTSDDTADLAAGVVPRSLFQGDGTHWTALARARFLIPIILEALSNVGWRTSNVRRIAIRKAADETVNNSVALQNDDHFAFPIGANETWTVRFALFTSAGSNATDLKVAFTTPTGATLIWNAHAQRPSDAGLTTYNAATASGGTVEIQNGAAGITIGLAIIELSVVNGPTPGTVQMQWAQVTAGTSDTTIKAGSTMIAHKV